ncbi:DUF5320 family protein [Anoxynatronum buryatiense]|uniref:DUF5320 domain-containing protein n=1 Tax=Anoxynatronum buryatiense TaxID=489973 RepID=A0AA45WTJ5_9CLOT|nr:DUF5320 family protein [Anoxynatronum buryatiense]SMP43293.1 hypothetical protein SAMN06296020_10258 [Anoxynatronum buryatiense]
MPGRDGTGPGGQGPMMGWGNGFCKTFRPLGMGRGVRRGGMGMGRGPVFGPGVPAGTKYGCGRGYGGYGPFWGTGETPEEQAAQSQWTREALKEQREWLKKRLDIVEMQLDNGTNDE